MVTCEHFGQLIDVAPLGVESFVPQPPQVTTVIPLPPLFPRGVEHTAHIADEFSFSKVHAEQFHFPEAAPREGYGLSDGEEENVGGGGEVGGLG